MPQTKYKTEKHKLNCATSTEKFNLKDSTNSIQQLKIQQLKIQQDIWFPMTIRELTQGAKNFRKTVFPAVNSS